ncbi:MAG: helicase-related protein, partial [Clostridia bacterium]
LRMLVPELVPSVVQLKRDLEHDASILNTRFRGIYISRTRKDIGVESNYIPHVHTVKPMGSQRGMSGAEMFKYTRGQGAYNQVNKLIEVIKSHRPGKGIVFVWQHVVRNFVEGELRNTDIKFESISGLTNNKERARIMKEFNEGKLDTVLISTKTSVDLDSDYVFFYEFTVDVRQVIGRAERGLNPKDLHIHWLFTQETGEFDYFKENIYNRSLLVRNVVGTQCDDLDEVATTIGG